MALRRKVVVVGIGYVGFPLAVMLAKAGHEVVGVDSNENLVASVNDGLLHLTESEIGEVFSDPLVKRNLHAQTVPTEGDVFVISVQTPLDHRKRVADLSHVDAALRSILPHFREGNLLIIESTVPPLTCRTLIRPVIESTGLKVGADLHVAHCPERILPGNVFEEIIHNSRVIGGMDPDAGRLAAELYSSFVEGELFICDDITAELVKLMENTYRDVNIALANEFAAVSESLGVDVERAIELANMHPRVDILQPGIGTGGHCIPVDPWFIKQVDPVNTRLIHAARAINDEIPRRIAAKIRRAVRNVSDPTIVAIGRAYKPNTYDTRESPAMRIVQILRDDGYQVQSYDPLVSGCEYPSIASIASGADCLVILVEHDAVIEELDQGREEIEDSMANPVILRFPFVVGGR